VRKIDVKTDQELLKNIEDAVKKGISKTDIENQRISIIYAGMPKDSEITKDEIRRAVG